MPVPSSDVPYGFLLVTSDPSLAAGRRGHALDLVRARLTLREWPIYARTRSRRAMRAGQKLAFYVGGRGPGSRTIVATATVDTVDPVPRIGRQVDPPKYLTGEPVVVLRFRDVVELETPVQFRDALPHLSFRPRNLHKWGIILHGGSRAVTPGDWEILFARR